MDEPVDLEGGLDDALRQANALRRREADDAGAPREAVERVLDSLFAPGRRLAVYGSLAPGRENEHELADVPGEWFDGFVHGELSEVGWGAAMGYPALRLDPAAQRVPVSVLVSAELDDHWDRLDAFEGEQYRRVLVVVRDAEGRALAVANVYEASSR